MTAKEKLLHLVDDLSESQAKAALSLVEEGMGDPLIRVLDNAPPDDEPTSPEEDEGATQAALEYRRGEAISAEQAKRELL